MNRLKNIGGIKYFKNDYLIDDTKKPTLSGLFVLLF